VRSLTCLTLAGAPDKSQGLQEKHREDTRHQIQDDSASEGKCNREKKPWFVAAIWVSDSCTNWEVKCV
jgi:hypothetical protein